MPKQFHNIGPRSNMIKCIINDANLFFSSIERQNDVDTLDVIEVRRIQKTKSEKQSLNDIKMSIDIGDHSKGFRVELGSSRNLKFNWKKYRRAQFGKNKNLQKKGPTFFDTDISWSVSA